MPIYDYACEPCRVHFDVSKRMSDSETEEHCPRCAGVAQKLPSLFAVDKTAAGAWNQASYNPGLGCWTKSTKHAEQIAKSRGLEPVGNETAESIQKYTKGRIEKAREERWEKADRDIHDVTRVTAPSLAG